MISYHQVMLKSLLLHCSPVSSISPCPSRSFRPCLWVRSGRGRIVPGVAVPWYPFGPWKFDGLPWLWGNFLVKKFSLRVTTADEFHEFYKSECAAFVQFFRCVLLKITNCTVVNRNGYLIIRIYHPKLARGRIRIRIQRALFQSTKSDALEWVSRGPQERMSLTGAIIGVDRI